MNEVLQQDTENKAKEQNMLIAQLLFKDKPEAASTDRLCAALQKLLGEIELVGSKEEVPMFALHDYKAVFKDAPQGVPVMACFTQPHSFDTEKFDPLTLSQLWDVQDGEGLLESCGWCVSVFGMMANALHYKQQAEVFLAQVSAALECYPDSEGIYVHPSGKLTTPAQFSDCMKFPMGDRFIRLAVNARFFNIEGTGDMLVDTLGMCAFGAPEVQLHFHGLDPNHVVNYVYNITSYQFEREFPIENGETIDGLGADGNIARDVRWTAQYENSLVQPIRLVLDVNCGEYAAGQRD